MSRIRITCKGPLSNSGQVNSYYTSFVDCSFVFVADDGTEHAMNDVHGVEFRCKAGGNVAEATLDFCNVEICAEVGS